MAQLISIQEAKEKYKHSPAHFAIACGDHESLKTILSRLPILPKAGDVTTEQESVDAEEAADRVSYVVDRRDVPGRETPLHLAVRLNDPVSVQMLMASGADWSLQNEHGWSALQEAVCSKQENIAIIITRFYQPFAWAKWCRRLPRITGAMRRMRDFYMEITFNFESSVIPFISRIAPSDTYRIWKRGSNLRADMTLAGFDGFKIQRSDQSFLFLGDGSEDGKVPPGSLLVLTHKDKEISNALEGAGAQPSEAEIAQEVATMSQTNMYRPGIDVTEAELVPQLSWRRQEKTEVVGLWKAKVYDMHHVHVSVRSRRVPGAMTDEELFASEAEAQGEQEDDYTEFLTEEEKKQLENAMMEETGDDDDEDDAERCNGTGNEASNSSKHDKNDSVMGSRNSFQDQKKTRWFGFSNKQKGDKKQPPGANFQSSGEVVKSELNLSKEDVSKKGYKESPESSRENTDDIYVNNTSADEILGKGKGKNGGRVDSIKDKKNQVSSSNNGNLENEYKKGLRPILWLTPDFPLKTEELLPLLDILANKVKAVRRLRELLTTKLPSGTFPVKVAIPIIPTIRVVVTFNKFEELANSEEFGTPLSSPAHFSESKGKENNETSISSSGSWLSWIKGSSRDQTSSMQEDCIEDIDPFVIPTDYSWIDSKEKKRRSKAKKAKNKNLKKPTLKPKELDGEVKE